MTTMFAQLLEVQQLDTKLDQLAHRRDALPERVRIAEADQILATLDKKLSDQELILAERRREQRRIEDELSTHQARAAGIEAKLYDGSVSAARELQDLQTELDGVHKHISGIEDEDLVAMEALEEADSQLEQLHQTRGQVEERRESAMFALSVAAAEIDAEADELTRTRTARADQIEPGLLSEYERLRTALGGIAVAKLNGNRCEGCHLTLPAVEVDRIHRLAAEERAYCDECGRMLVR